jgi:hypothetical protein
VYVPPQLRTVRTSGRARPLSSPGLVLGMVFGLCAPTNALATGFTGGDMGYMPLSFDAASFIGGSMGSMPLFATALLAIAVTLLLLPMRHLRRAGHAAAIVAAAVTVQSLARGSATRSALTALHADIRALDETPGDHLRLGDQLGGDNDFCLVVIAPPRVFGVWAKIEYDDNLVDVRGLLDYAIADATSATIPIQAGVRGWLARLRPRRRAATTIQAASRGRLLRRCVLPPQALADAIADSRRRYVCGDIGVSPHYGLLDVYLARLASGVSWVYCPRAPTLAPMPVADALALPTPPPPEVVPTKASSARQKGRQREAAARARRRWRTAEGQRIRDGVVQHEGLLYRRGSTRDRKRLGRAEDAACHPWHSANIFGTAQEMWGKDISPDDMMGDGDDFRAMIDGGDFSDDGGDDDFQFDGDDYDFGVSPLPSPPTSGRPSPPPPDPAAGLADGSTRSAPSPDPLHPSGLAASSTDGTMRSARSPDPPAAGLTGSTHGFAPSPPDLAAASFIDGGYMRPGAVPDLLHLPDAASSTGGTTRVHPSRTRWLASRPSRPPRRTMLRLYHRCAGSPSPKKRVRPRSTHTTIWLPLCLVG